MMGDDKARSGPGLEETRGTKALKQEDCEFGGGGVEVRNCSQFSAILQFSQF